MKDIAICAIGYNRPKSLQRLLHSLECGEYPDGTEVTLYISVDKSDSDDVLEVGESFNWKYGNKKVISHSHNLGLRKHILSCGNLLDNHDALIVLEDDIVIAPGFFCYVQQAVEKYFDNEEIAGISLYSFPVNNINFLPFIPLRTFSDVYLMQCAQSWGQVWMKKQWKAFRKWYDENNDEFKEEPHLPKSICNWSKSSWLKYHIRYCIEKSKFFVYPYTSFSTCFADQGIHIRQATTNYQAAMMMGKIGELKFDPQVRYDGFFECLSISDWLKIPSDEICIDFYGDKNNMTKRRYWLSRKSLPFKVVKGYALRYFPYETNILFDLKGTDLILYDTLVPARRPFADSLLREISFYNYLYKCSFSPRSILSLWINRIIRKRSVY